MRAAPLIEVGVVMSGMVMGIIRIIQPWVNYRNALINKIFNYGD